jgi:hypothetical protein
MKTLSHSSPGEFEGNQENLGQENRSLRDSNRLPPEHESRYDHKTKALSITNDTVTFQLQSRL